MVLAVLRPSEGRAAVPVLAPRQAVEKPPSVGSTAHSSIGTNPSSEPTPTARRRCDAALAPEGRVMEEARTGTPPVSEDALSLASQARSEGNPSEAQLQRARHVDPAVDHHVDHHPPTPVDKFRQAVAAKDENEILQSVKSATGAEGEPVHHAAEAALREAAQTGDMWMVGVLVSCGIDVNADGFEQAEAAHCPCCHPQEEAQAPLTFHPTRREDLLREHHDEDADKALSAMYCSPLIWAALSGHVHIVQHLTEHGADLRRMTRCGRGNAVYYRDRAFVAAATHGHVDVVRYLAKFGCCADAAGPPHSSWQKATCESIHGDVDTALTRAAYRGHADVVHYLLSNHAEDITGREREAALGIAQHRKHGRVVELLTNVIAAIRPPLDAAARRPLDAPLPRRSVPARAVGNSPQRPAAHLQRLAGPSPARLSAGIPSAARRAAAGDKFRPTAEQQRRTTSGVEARPERPAHRVAERQASREQAIPRPVPGRSESQRHPTASPLRGLPRQRSYTRVPFGSAMRASGTRVASKSIPTDALVRIEAAALEAAKEQQNTSHLRSASAAVPQRRIVSVSARVGDRRVSSSPQVRRYSVAPPQSPQQHVPPPPPAPEQLRGAPRAVKAGMSGRQDGPRKSTHRHTSPPVPGRMQSCGHAAPVRAAPREKSRERKLSNAAERRPAMAGATAAKRTASAARPSAGRPSIARRTSADMPLRTQQRAREKQKAYDAQLEYESYHRRHWLEVTKPRIAKWVSEVVRPVDWLGSPSSSTHALPAAANAEGEQVAMYNALRKELDQLQWMVALPQSSLKAAIKGHRFGCGCVLCVLQKSDLSDHGHVQYLLKQEIRRDEDLLSFVALPSPSAASSDPACRTPPRTLLDPTPPMRVHTAAHTPPRQSLTPPADRKSHPTPAPPLVQRLV